LTPEHKEKNRAGTDRAARGPLPRIEITPMQPKAISVILALGTDPYRQRLPAALLGHGMLRRVLRFGGGLDLEVLDANEAGSLEQVKRFSKYEVVNRFVWGAWRRLPGTGRSQLPKVASTWLADRLASKYVSSASIFHGLLGVCFACLQAAKRRGAITVLENPTLHLQRWQDEVKAECNHFGVHPRNCDALLPTPLLDRARREYELSDKIIVLSSVARRSFEQFGCADKAVVVWPGVDHLFFTPALEPGPAHLFRTCYVGRVELAKGVGYLLQAWKQLELAGAELLLVGEVKPEMKSLLKSCTSNVRLLGVLPPQELAQGYRESSVFVFPSANEGLGMVLLEAMASGLPVISTDRTGAADFVSEGKQGFVVPARNVDALAERILWCYQHPNETMAMGRAARTKVEQHFTLSHYEERQIALYRSIGS
jgi:glycosyltransferase involved in cell wall biosynthesis